MEKQEWRIQKGLLLLSTIAIRRFYINASKYTAERDEGFL